MGTDEFATELRCGRLTTAEVLYYMPDHPELLQSFIWQTLARVCQIKLCTGDAKSKR